MCNPSPNLPAPIAGITIKPKIHYQQLHSGFFNKQMIIFFTIIDIAFGPLQLVGHMETPLAVH